MPETIEFYWRPGCGFCMALERSLNKLNIPLDKKNIWDDPAHAETVRTLAGGNETVPTLVIGETALVNPSAKQVLQAMSNEVPHLIPEGVEVPTVGKAGRVISKLLGGG